MDWPSVGRNGHSNLDSSLYKKIRGSSKIYTMHTHSIIHLFIHYNTGFFGVFMTVLFYCQQRILISLINPVFMEYRILI